MKKIRVIFLSGVSVLLTIMSCTNVRNSKNNVVVDSVDVVEETPRHYQDEDKVIADLKFFISEKDFDRNEDKYLKPITDKNGWYYIGNLWISSVSKKFENDSLYYVSLVGHACEADDFNSEVIPEYNELLKIYQTKYGNPSFQEYSFPEPYEISDGCYIELSRWDLGKRTISIRLVASSYWYKIRLDIFRNDINDRVEKRQRKQDKGRQTSAASVI